jgi:hypothetical protein
MDEGLERPTLIHKSPEEALNLSLFGLELRPYLTLPEGNFLRLIS